MSIDWVSVGGVFAFALSCPHQNAAVKWVPQHNQFECTKHDSHYLADGLHVAGRATRNLDRLPISKEGNSVRVDTAHAFQSDKDAAGWNAATLMFMPGRRRLAKRREAMPSAGVPARLRVTSNR